VSGSVRRTALALIALLGLLAAALTYHQTIAADDYREDLRNPRALARAGAPRGRMITADGVVVAESVPAPDDPGRLVRVYPGGETFAHVTGYSTEVFGNTALEARRNDDLASADDRSLRARLLRTLGDDLGASDVHLTIHSDLQEAAAAALGDQRGAVVALDPATGAVLAMVSAPSFDPNSLVGSEGLEVGAALTADRDDPLLNRATAGLFPPGSTFKLITAAAGLDSEFVTPETRLPDSAELALPGSTSTITNFDGGVCGDGTFVTLERALAISCNTAFADLGMRLGAAALVETAEKAGWNARIPFDLVTATSTAPPAEVLDDDLPAIAQTALGQRDVRATPLQMALVAAAVANGGVVMKPHLVESVVGPVGGIVDRAQPEQWRRATTEDVANALGRMMQAVVTDGSGWRAQIPGLAVAGKTGTAEVPGAAPDVWFVAFAQTSSDSAGTQIAVAVVVEEGGSAGEDGTGGTVAAPVAAQVLEAWSRSGAR
jgi:peptidoglycan glycosyltransferase